MIAFVKGKVSSKTEKSAVIEVGGVGYRVFCSSQTLNDLNEGQEKKLFTYLNLGRETLELYGFSTLEEAELFQVLNGISGVGPRTASVLSSFGSMEKLKEAIESQDNTLLAAVKGIGKKRMQKIILELTGKIKELDKKEDEALETLISLGFLRQQAQAALDQVSDVEKAEERVKKALKILGENKGQ